MENEHFGITIVEMMVFFIFIFFFFLQIIIFNKSAGLITIAHNSAGAKEDII